MKTLGFLGSSFDVIGTRCHSAQVSSFLDIL